MKFSVFLMAVSWGGGAAADPGHVAGVAGHDHWLAAVAIGAAIAAAIWGALKGRGDRAGVGAEPESDASRRV